MKLEFTASEFECFCANLRSDPGNVAMVADLQHDLKASQDALAESSIALRNVLEDLAEVKESRNRLQEEQNSYACEATALRREVVRLRESSHSPEMEFFRTLIPSYVFKCVKLSQAVKFLTSPTKEKIQAIKTVKEGFGFDLRTAKETVEGTYSSFDHPDRNALSAFFSFLTGHDEINHDHMIALLQKAIPNASYPVLEQVVKGIYNPYLMNSSFTPAGL